MMDKVFLSRVASFAITATILFLLGILSPLYKWKWGWDQQSRNRRAFSSSTTKTTMVVPYHDPQQQQQQRPWRMEPVESQWEEVMEESQELTTTQAKVVMEHNANGIRAIKSGIVPRPFLSWNYTSLPCVATDVHWKDKQHSHTPATVGFLYLKPYKTGSSTSSGINLRLARNVARRYGRSTMCDARFDHGPDFTPGRTLFGERVRQNGASFLWTVLREPTERVVSHFFHFAVSKRKREPSDQNFLRLLHSGSFPFEDYYLQALYTRDIFTRHQHNPVQVSNEILDDYDFIGVTERMDESLVVLMMLLDVPMADILHLSAKQKGGYDGQCHYIWPSFVSPGMKDYFSSPKWQDTVQYDNLLYTAVNHSLDLTIDRLGRTQFHTQLTKFRSAQTVAREECSTEARFPCDAGGSRVEDTDCLWKDSGCGTGCLDRVATMLDLW